MELPIKKRPAEKFKILLKKRLWTEQGSGYDLITAKLLREVPRRAMKLIASRFHRRGSRAGFKHWGRQAHNFVGGTGQEKKNLILNHLI